MGGGIGVEREGRGLGGDGRSSQNVRSNERVQPQEVKTGQKLV